MPTLLPPKITINIPECLLALLITVLLSWIVSFQQARADNKISLPVSIQESRFIAYTPRSFSIKGEKVSPGTRSGIRKDLEILHPYFNGVITYSAINGVEHVAEVASNLKYRSVIMGIWDPSSEIEINNVLQAFHKYPDLVSAVVVGNEGIYTKRYTTVDVQQAIIRIKKMAPSLPVTTSEPFYLYLTPEYSDFFRSHDLLMPNIHPVFEKWFTPNKLEDGVSMVLNIIKELQTAYRLPVLIKETGLPSGEAAQGYSQAGQARFWNELTNRFPSSPTLGFAYFEAFDTPWKPALMATEFPGNHTKEAYWGLYTTTGQAKEVITPLPRLKDHPHTPSTTPKPAQ